MAWRFLQCSLDQPLLLALRDWLPEDHLARFIAEIVGQLDLSCLLKQYQRRDARGRLGCHPEMLLRVLIYGYCVGILSSRRIESALATDVAFRFLASNQLPDHSTTCDFRKMHLAEFGELFVKVLLLCRQAQMVQLGAVALDGTKMKANASRHRTYGILDRSARLRVAN